MRVPQTAPSLAKLFDRSVDAALFAKILDAPSATLPDGRYLHWNELRHRDPPPGWTREMWWLGMKFRRSCKAQAIEAMKRVYGAGFEFVALAEVQRKLHEFDRVNVGREILSALGDPDAQREYRLRQLVEEAISSSEIEGARPTTRDIARQMLRERREPTSLDERMIANNWRAMERLRELHVARTPLTLEHLLELHRILGEGALEVPDAAGRFRTPEHKVAVTDADGTIWHYPPDANGLRERMTQLLAFANGESAAEEAFVHPIVRAIVCHFWLAYEHPFRDGNGRMARALFYWCMLRHDYEVAEFLSISGPIDRRRKAYYLAFAHVETDAGDLTYFVLHQLEVMRIALDELLQHVKQRAERLRELSSLVAAYDELNHRQRSLLQHAIRHAEQGQTIEGHASSHGVHYLTARKDLNDLEQRKLMRSRKVGKLKRYYAAQSLVGKSRRIGRGGSARRAHGVSAKQ